MRNVLVLTTDLPYFPGKNGHDFFNLRFLARTYRVGVVAPCYESYPAEGVSNLEQAIQATYLWPRKANSVPLFAEGGTAASLPDYFRWIPRSWRLRLLERLLEINEQPAEAYERLAILANCAPNLLQALHDHPWEAVVLIQTSLAPWLHFLPRFGTKVVYFHDVRSDFLARATAGAQPREIAAVHRQEQDASAAADAVGFVSALDEARARQSLRRLPPTAMVAPIPVDTDYFIPRPAGQLRTDRKIVLFTGHLRHPPNVDAVLYFLAEIWPRVLQQLPEAVFQAVGLTPDPRLAAAVAQAERAELHASVPDIRPFFWDASAYVIPMRFGGGVRQKIFEAWSMRVPVVSTTMGAEGTDARSAFNCWLEDDPGAFANRVVDLLAHGAPAEFLNAAETTVRSANAIPVAASAFTQLVGRAISARRRQPFRLLYDLRWMKLGEAGGVEQMTYELVHAISQIDRDNQYRFYAPRSTFQEWALDRRFQHRRFYSDAREKRWESLGAVFTNQLSESLDLPPVLSPEMRTLRAYRRMDFDLVHSMLCYIHPDMQAFPNILTITDLQHLTYPEFFTAPDWETRERLYRTSAQRAAHITCISEFTRQEVHRHYGIPLERMTTIWIIPSRNLWLPLEDDERATLLCKMGLHEPFLFFPAHCWPHKNHERLVEAFALIRPHIASQLRLVFTGRPFPADHPAAQAIRKHGLESRIVHLGFRSPLEIRALYHSCLLVVFPSLFEGFGMPVAEAMIAGKPVACSNVTSLPEIAGEAALTFDPTNVHDIGGRLLEIINDSTRRERLQQAAVARRPLFSARKIALETLSLYRRVHEALYES